MAASEAGSFRSLDLAAEKPAEHHVESLTSVHPTDRSRPRSPLRWALLFLGVLVIIGPYYAFDPSGALIELREYYGVVPMATINTTAAQNASLAGFNGNYQLLYSSYSFPNLVMPFVSGALVDSLGVRPMVVATSALAFGGQVMVTGGVLLKSWPLMWVGRGVFGIGTEGMCVALRGFLSLWFLGKELGISNAAQLSIGRAGGVASINVAALFSPSTVWLAFGVGALVCAASVIAAIVAVVLDKRWEKKNERLSREVGSKQQQQTRRKGSDLGFLFREREVSTGSSSASKGAHGASFSSFHSVTLQGASHPATDVQSSLEPLPEVLREHSLADFSSVGSSTRDLRNRKITLSLPLDAYVIGEPAYEVAAAVDAALEATGTAADDEEGAPNGRAESASSNQPFLTRQASASKAALLSHTDGEGEGEQAPQGHEPRRCPKWFPDFTQVKHFKGAYWLLCVLSVVGFSPVTTFSGIIPALVKQRWESSGQQPTVAEVNRIAAILYGVAAGTAPFLGWMLSKLNYNAVLLASQLAISACHFAFAFSPNANEPALLAILGLSFGSFAAAFWTQVALFVPVTALGLAFGLMGAVQNSGLAATPFLVAALQPPAYCDNSYRCLEFAFGSIAAVGALVSLILLLMELHARRKARQQRRKAEWQPVQDWGDSASQPKKVITSSINA